MRSLPNGDLDARDEHVGMEAASHLGRIRRFKEQLQRLDQTLPSRFDRFALAGDIELGTQRDEHVVFPFDDGGELASSLHAAILRQRLVVTFRCTRSLLDRLTDSVVSTPARSTTALGDWYFKLLFTRPQWLLLGVSEKSRLPVVLPARPLDTLTIRFGQALEAVLEDLAVSKGAIAAERASMQAVTFARTIDRHVLGSLNELAFAVQWARQDRPIESLHALSLSLADTPILPLKDFPDQMSRRLLESRGRH